MIDTDRSPEDRSPGDGGVSAPARRPRREPRSLLAFARDRRTRRVGRIALLLLVAAVGAWLGMLVGGRATADVGPVQAGISFRPSLVGDTVVDVAPLGSVRFDTHDGPLAMDVSLKAVDVKKARSLLADSGGYQRLDDRLVHDLRGGVAVAAVRGVVSGVIGALVLGALTYRSTRRSLATGGLAGLLVLGSYGAAVLTFDQGAVKEPRYSGVLAGVPALVGDARDIASNVNTYGRQLSRLVDNVSKLYTTTLALPGLSTNENSIRLLHISDLHLNPAAWPVVEGVAKQYDVAAVVDTGDIADHGSSLENGYVDEIGRLGVPYVYVRGNHDSTSTENEVRTQPNAVVMDGTVHEVAGVRFLGQPDPRFTPDQSTRGKGDEQIRTATQALAEHATYLSTPPDVELIHDPTYASLLDGTTPLVLAGHTHKRSEKLFPDKTRLLVQGSTGGAGLRALEGEQPTPVTLTVLYLDPQTKKLTAWDEITLGGLGLASAEIQRRVPERQGGPEPTPSPAPSTGVPLAPALEPSAGPPTVAASPLPAAAG